ncbi:MAG: hypothetical protein JW739_07405 [Opitutales bacterium]|nr:hypothetical protein [Opitutales bacterium]
METEFRNSTISTPGWSRGGSSSLTGGSLDQEGSGWLRLTANTTYQIGYAAYMGTPVPAADKTLYVSFEYKMWGPDSTLADGFTFFLFDGARNTFRIGANGGSLGYAQKTGVPGLGSGYVGIGFDVFGNYSNPTEGRVGGTGSNSNTISVRGNEASNYAYVMGTSDSNVFDLSGSMSISRVSSRPVDAVSTRKVAMILTPTNQLTIFMQVGTGKMAPLFTADLSGQTRPETFRFGFAGTTGGSRQYAEIRDVVVTVYDALRWDNGSGDFYWNTADNWVGDVLPEESPLEDVKFDNQTGLTLRQDVNLNLMSHPLRTVTMDAPFAYRLYDGTLLFQSAVKGLSLNSTSRHGSAAHTVDADIVSTDLLTINIANPYPMTLNGAIDNGGYELRFTGDQGRINLNGVVSGYGGLTKEDAFDLYVNGDVDSLYRGDTLLLEGNIYLDVDPVSGVSRSALGRGVITLENGTELHLLQDNQIYDRSDMTMEGGTFYLNGNDELH